MTKSDMVFKPNLSPHDIFDLGSFGGTYWRPIKSSIINKNLKNIHKQYKFLEDIPETKLTREIYDKTENKYGVKVGTSLEYWESKNWIHKEHPYGWVHWYCDYSLGFTSDDDERQIKRWEGLAGPKGRFRLFLITQIQKKNGKWNDESISPKIRQTLQHWGYKLTKKDYDTEIRRQNKQTRKTKLK